MKSRRFDKKDDYFRKLTTEDYELLDRPKPLPRRRQTTNWKKAWDYFQDSFEKHDEFFGK